MQKNFGLLVTAVGRGGAQMIQVIFQAKDTVEVLTLTLANREPLKTGTELLSDSNVINNFDEIPPRRIGSSKPLW